jgi:hypothetical protein
MDGLFRHLRLRWTPDDVVTGVAKDRDGNIWLGTRKAQLATQWSFHALWYGPGSGESPVNGICGVS